MKSWKNRLIVPAAGASIVAAFSLLLYLDITGKASAGGAEQVGVVTFKRQVAQRKYASQVVWENLASNIPVYNYDTIRTSDLSEAVIRLTDGTEIALNENSMILLAMTRDDMTVEFERGSMAATRAGTEAGRKLSITAGGTTVAMAKGDLNLSQGKAKELSLSLASGAAVVKAGDNEKTLGLDQRVVVGEDMKVFEQGVRLLAPGPREYLITAAGAATVAFSWERLKPGGGAVLEVSRDPSFALIAEGRKAAANTVALRLPPGVYYWRVKAVQRKTGRIEYSESRRLAVLRNETPRLISPTGGTTFPFSARPPVVNFTWSHIAGESAHTLIIARDGEMKDRVKALQVSGNAIAVDDLPAGVYYWRVDRSVAAGGKESVLVSAVGRFAVEKMESLPPPEPLYPADGTSITRLGLEKGGLTFTWKKSFDHPRTRLTVARDKEFTTVLRSAEVTINFAELGGALDNGVYYWKVTGVVDEKTVTPPSAAWSFSVTEGGEIELISPAGDAVVTPGEGEKNASVEFLWKRLDVPGKFNIQMAKDANFGSMYREHATDAYGQVLEDVELGDYHWRVSLLDGDGNVLLTSPARLLRVREALAMPAPLAPLGGAVIDMREKDALTFRWKGVKGASVYRVGLYQVRKGIYYNIIQKETPGTELEMKELEKLDVGDFYWTLQALDAPGGKAVLRRSPEARQRFSISLGDVSGKPKLTSPKILYIE